MDNLIRELLQKSKTIAVVGLSNKPERESFRVARYLQDNGYRVIPVNPMIDEALGEKAYPDLSSVPEKIDLVDVFRRSDQTVEVVEKAAEHKIPAVWLQLGITSPAGYQLASKNGVIYIENKCIMIEHRRLMI